MQLLSKSQGEIALATIIPDHLASFLIPSATPMLGMADHGDFLFQDITFPGGMLRVSYLMARSDEILIILDDHGGIFFQLILMDTLNCRMNGMGQFIHHEWGYNLFYTNSVFKEIAVRKGHTYKFVEIKFSHTEWENVASQYDFVSPFLEQVRYKISSRLAKAPQIASLPMIAAAEKIISGSAFSMTDIIHELLFQSFEKQLRASNDKPIRIAQEDVDHIYDIKRFLFSHLPRHYSLEDLTLLKSIDPYQLRKGFKALYGITAFQLAHFERMRRAAELVGRGDKKAWEIATLLGYHSESAFSRAFRKYNKGNAY